MTVEGLESESESPYIELSERGLDSQPPQSAHMFHQEVQQTQQAAATNYASHGVSAGWSGDPRYPAEKQKMQERMQAQERQEQVWRQREQQEQQQQYQEYKQQEQQQEGVTGGVNTYSSYTPTSQSNQSFTERTPPTAVTGGYAGTSTNTTMPPTQTSGYGNQGTAGGGGSPCKECGTHYPLPPGATTFRCDTSCIIIILYHFAVNLISLSL